MNGCQVQTVKGRICSRSIVATWDWGGPTLLMCESHDGEMKHHVKTCKPCRDRLTRATKGQAQ